MPGRIYVDGFEKRLDKDGVYACLKCTQDSDVYEEVEESYQALLPSFFQSAPALFRNVSGRKIPRVKEKPKIPLCHYNFGKRCYDTVKSAL